PRAPGAVRAHLVPAVGQRDDGGRRGERLDAGTGALREVEVVLDQGVLRVVRAPRHAGAAVEAGAALGSGAPEVGVRHGRAGGPVRPRGGSVVRAGTGCLAVGTEVD